MGSYHQTGSQGRTMMVMVVTLLILLGGCSAQIILDTFESRIIPRQRARTGRQDNSAVTGGVDFNSCVTDPETGLCCVDKEETVTSLEKEPILECTHKNTEQCHY